MLGQCIALYNIQIYIQQQSALITGYIVDIILGVWIISIHCYANSKTNCQYYTPVCVSLCLYERAHIISSAYICFWCTQWVQSTEYTFVNISEWWFVPWNCEYDICFERSNMQNSICTSISIYYIIYRLLGYRSIVFGVVLMLCKIMFILIYIYRECVCVLVKPTRA